MEPFQEARCTSRVEKVIALSTHVAGVYLRLESRQLEA